MSWKLVVRASKRDVEQALDRRNEMLDWDETLVLAGFEIAPDAPDAWQLDAYCEKRPGKAQRAAVASLFDEIASIEAEKLPDVDWVTESQKGVQPIRAGAFYVHTPDYPPSTDTGVTSFCIPAAQAFGTGQHETTAGCLEMLQAMHAQGIHPRHLIDIGTGTGLLAFAALELWPHANATASDIDPVCLPATVDNAARNGFAMGMMPGKLAMTVADGMDDPLLLNRAPYDLLIANILAGPLMEMADDFADAVAPRGHALLSGLLVTQEPAVRSAWRRAGFRLHRRLHRGDWSILWLRKRYRG